MSQTVPVHTLVLTYKDRNRPEGYQETFRYPSLEFALGVFNRYKERADPALWNAAIYNRHGDCLVDLVSERNRVTSHVEKQSEFTGGLKSLYVTPDER